MPSTPERRAKARAKAKADRALIDPNTPRVPQGEIPWPTEAEMLARLEGAQERAWGATASRVNHTPRIVGRGSGAVRPGKDEY